MPDMLFSDFGSLRSPDASHEVRVLEKALFGAKVRIVIDPEMPPDEMWVLSPADNDILSKIRDIKLQEDGSITYMAEFKKPADFILLDLGGPHSERVEEGTGPCGDTMIGSCTGIEGDGGCEWCENYKYKYDPGEE